MDLGFIALLFLTSASGLALWLGRGTPALARAAVPAPGRGDGACSPRCPTASSRTASSAPRRCCAHAIEKRQPNPIGLGDRLTDHSRQPSQETRDEQTPPAARHGAGRASLLLAGLGHAQDFPPKKPVTLVVGFARRRRGRCGGAPDRQEAGREHRPDRGRRQQGRRRRQHRAPAGGQRPGRRHRCCCSARSAR